MNPLTNMKNVQKLSERELQNTSKSSWHDQYKDSAWIFVGGLPYDLTEGDIICIFSQYGEVVNVNLIRAKDTGKSRGFCFLCYEDQRSTILAVDNFNGIKILNRTIRVDHVQEYKVPKEGKKTDEETKKLYSEGCAPKAMPIVPKVERVQQDLRETIADQIEGELKLPARLPIYTDIKKEKVSEDESENKSNKDKKKSKKKKKKSKKKKSRKSGTDTDESSSDSSSSDHAVKSKKRDRSRSPNRRKKSHKSSEKSKEHKERYSEDYRKDSPKRRDRSKSKERDGDNEDKPKRYYVGFSPTIPKRWK